ncbi:MAG TPA: hypothetical protein VGH38_15265 [Bryobacteraceae bacterium]
MPHIGSRVILAAMSLSILPSAHAQDPFEIHVYEYETLRRGDFTFETHLNYVGNGTKIFDGPVAPFQDQFHMTVELTAGLTDHTSLGFMQLNARRPGGSLEYAGWRVLPHFYAPRSWHLPLDVGLVTEFSFQKTTYEENARRVEVRPILEKTLGKVQLDFNPVFERALHGPGTSGGWNFEPAARVGYEVWERFTPSLEYYSALGPLPDFLPASGQVHQILPGGDWKLAKNVEWSFGVGIGATPAGNRLVYKSRIEISFGFH